MKHFFSIDQLPSTAWKNGGGVTREILCWPPGADLSNFDWRVSIASISASGPFSSFPGIDRVIMLLEGDGVWLRGPNTDWRLERPGEPFAFRGEEEINGELLGSSSTDFNVMTRRGAAQVHVQVIGSSRAISTQDAGLVFVCTGSWLVDQRSIEKGQGFWWTDSVHFSLDAAKYGENRALLVNWTRPARVE